jgi:hypothetical protein
VKGGKGGEIDLPARLACVVRCGLVALEMPARVSALCRSVLYLVPLASAAQAVSPAFLRSPSAGRRSSVATPVESATPAGSNSRLAMQGRDDRETRGSELIACKISCLARSVSRCACYVPE